MQNDCKQCILKFCSMLKIQQHMYLVHIFKCIGCLNVAKLRQLLRLQILTLPFWHNRTFICKRATPL